MERFPKPYFFLLGLFAFLCGLHYSSARPLWLDEEYVFKSIEQLSFRESFGRLVGAQVFPRVHLVSIKALGQLFNNHLLSLRFFSLVFMLSAFTIWSRIFRNSFKNNNLFLLAVFSFVCSYRLIYYGAELKPYSMDVLVVGCFCLYACWQGNFRKQTPSTQLYIGAALLPFLMFFSYAGLFVFWMPAHNFMCLVRKNKSLVPVLVLNLVISLLCFSLYCWIDLRHSVHQVEIYSYWESYFISLESVGGFFSTFGEGFQRIVTHWFGTEKIHYKILIPFIPLVMISIFNNGIKPLIKDNLKILSVGSFGFILLAELFVFGMLRIYPFTGSRITLFLAPVIIYFIVKGIADCQRTKVLYFGLFSYFLIYCTFCLGNSFFAILKFYG